MINDKVDPFITQYRDALERDRDLSFQSSENSRRNDFGSIMGNANTSGMMYSNFPERTKIQYDTTTHMPRQTKIQNTYQTGLDKLRSNVVNLSNKLKDINDSIADLNKTSAANTNAELEDTTKSYDFGNGYIIYGKKGSQAIYNVNGKPVSAGEFLEGLAKNGGEIDWDKWNELWDYMHTKDVGPDTLEDYYGNKGGLFGTLGVRVRNKRLYGV